VKFSKLALAAGVAFALVLPTVGCSDSSSDNKQPKVVGPDPAANAKPAGRGAGGAATKGPASSQAPLSKN